MLCKGLSGGGGGGGGAAELTGGKIYRSVMISMPFSVRVFRGRTRETEGKKASATSPAGIQKARVPKVPRKRRKKSGGGKGGVRVAFCKSVAKRDRGELGDQL